MIDKIKLEYRKICIKLHLYYLDILDKFNNKFNNIVRK